MAGGSQIVQDNSIPKPVTGSSGEGNVSMETVELLLTQLLTESRKPITASATAELDGEVLADIILNLNRDNKRLA